MKGISVILGAVLLIAITVLASSILLNWGPAVFQAPQEQVENRTTNCASASVQIQDVFLDVNNSIGRITVFNSGFGDDSIVNARIVSERGLTSFNLSEYPINFPKGQQVTLEVATNESISECGNFSRAYVSTSCGATAEFGRFNEEPTCYVESS